MGGYLEGFHPYKSLEVVSCEPLEASGLKPLTYGCGLLLSQHLYGYIFIIVGMHHNGWVAETPAHTSG